VNGSGRPTRRVVEKGLAGGVHFSERFNSMFTVLNNDEFHAVLRDRINWVAIVAP
jgi:hypothetical protein